MERFVWEILEQIRGKKNFVFVGEAGSGKSEIAVNFAFYLKTYTEKEVHFFDMDMTKPLYRSRDVGAGMEDAEIAVHYEEQFADAPTAVGGVKKRLQDEKCYVVMDVGGDYIGARSIGAYASGLNAEETIVYYVMNAFRPWSSQLWHVDRTLGAILNVSHIRLEQVHMISNPNMGAGTTKEEFFEGNCRMKEMIAPYKPIDFACVRKELYPEIKDACAIPVLPIRLYLTYDWLITAG